LIIIKNWTKMNELSPEEDRLLVELADLYEIWRPAQQDLMRGRYRWKKSAGTDYLYCMAPGSDSGVSCGPRGPKTELSYSLHREAELRSKQIWPRMLIKGRMLKAARVPTITAVAGQALRALDQAGLLGPYLRVVGSTALPAYEQAAGVKLEPAFHATDDADLTWVASPSAPAPSVGILETLKKIDGTWTVNTERPFQTINRSGDILEVLVAPSLAAAYPQSESIRAVETPGQEWLLAAKPLERVVCDASGRPARIVAPDPRLFALHKLHLSTLEYSRKREKRTKDRRQGLVLMQLIVDRMPEYPFSAAFLRQLPLELKAHYANWLQDRQQSPSAINKVSPGNR
jgi:hypothetical protein